MKACVKINQVFIYVPHYFICYEFAFFTTEKICILLLAMSEAFSRLIRREQTNYELTANIKTDIDYLLSE